MPKVWQSQLGLTLVEVVIVVGMFSGLILATTRVFITTADVRQRTVNEHDLQADLKYGLGMLLYEAEKEVIQCTAPQECICGLNLTDKFYGINVDQTALYFFNDAGFCCTYYLDDDNGKIMVQRGNGSAEVLTSDQISISDLHFTINDNADRFTVTAKAEKTGQAYAHQLILQTSITATNYEN